MKWLRLVSGIKHFTEREENLIFLFALIPLKIIKLFDDYCHLADKTISLPLILSWILNTLPFFIFLALVWKTKSLKVNAGLYLVIALLVTAFCSTGELTGATLLYLFCYAWDNKKLLIEWVIISVVIIAIKYSIMKCSIPEMLIYQIGYFFIFRKLFFLTWPAKPDIIKRGMIQLTQTHEYIITYLRHGFNQKQIAIASQSWKADEKNLTYDQIHGRVSELFEMFGATNTAHLIELLWRDGYIKQTIVNIDKQLEK